MFGFLKNLLRKRADAPDAESYVAVENEYVEPQSAPVPAAPQPRAIPTQVRRVPNGTHPQNRGVEVSLQSILATLPLELQPRIANPDVGSETVSVPLEKILSQLSRGAVKISFGELRLAAPHVFSGGNERDRVLVPLPLSEILSKLNPALITRRRVQKQIEVPQEISSPFDNEGGGLIFSIGPTKPEKPDTTPPVAPVTRQQPQAPSPVQMRQALTSAPTPAAPSAMPAQAPALIPSPRLGLEFNGNHKAPASPANKAPTPPAGRVPMPPANRTPAPPATKAPLPPSTPGPVRGPGPLRLSAQPAQPEQAAPAAPASPAPAPKPAVQPASAQLPAPEENVKPPLVLGLTSLAEGWPEAVRQEIVQLNLVDAKVSLPAEVVERGLKLGRLGFTWKMVRSWIKPAPLPAVSAHDSAVLELPLKVIAPLFLARERDRVQAQSKVELDENIPNLFFGFPQADGAGPNSVAATTAQPADTNYYVWDDSSDTVRVHESETKRGPTPGTNFATKYATPNEVVSRAASLDGVAGALIALPDGLMVASRLSADCNADTLAAFLPQIFGKVSQCTKELRMGDLNNLNFTVGNTPWKIFRVNAIFFAAFGRAGEPLPTAQLAALAGELDHKQK